LQCPHCNLDCALRITQFPQSTIKECIERRLNRARWSRLNKINIRDLPLRGKLQSDLIQLEQSDPWCRYRKRHYAMSIKRLFDAVERRGDIGRRVAALVLPISNRPRVTSCCAGKIGLREPGEHTSGPNLASRDNVAHNQNLYNFWKRRHRSPRFDAAPDHIGERRHRRKFETRDRQPAKSFRRRICPGCPVGLLAAADLFSLRLCRQVCRRVRSRRAEARRNQSPRYLRGTMPRAP
jgi:hypothetical protein